MHIPGQIFNDFTEVTIENESFFTYITDIVLMQFLEKITDLNWVLQFPRTIPSNGRALIHEVATAYGLPSHSIGTKLRSTLVYPRLHYKEKQETEHRKIEKEFQKLKEKAKALIAPENPKTIRDKMIALISLESRAEPDQARVHQLKAEIFNSLDHVPVEIEAYKAFLDPIFAKKKL